MRPLDEEWEEIIKCYNLDCVDPIFLVLLGRSIWQMALTNDLCEVHHRNIGISLGMNRKRCADDIKW